MKGITALVTILLLAGCGMVDSMTEGFKHTQEVASDLEKTIGVRPFVGFNWSNGTLTNVSVTFDGIPENNDITEIVELSRRSVLRYFEQKPSQLIVAFSVESE